MPAGWINLFAFSVVAAHVAALVLMRPPPPLRHAWLALAGAVALCAEVVLVAQGDNGQLDWIPTPTPYHVAVGVWDWTNRNPIAVLALAIGVVQLCREAVPRAARWKAALVVVWLVAPLVATLLASIAQPAFEARYILAAAPAMALAIGAGSSPSHAAWRTSLPPASCSAQQPGSASSTSHRASRSSGSYKARRAAAGRPFGYLTNTVWFSVPLTAVAQRVQARVHEPVERRWFHALKKSAWASDASEARSNCPRRSPGTGR